MSVGVCGGVGVNVWVEWVDFMVLYFALATDS